MSKSEDKWKDYLLRSSLPLEQIVAEKLEKHGFYIAGEYAYTRPNESDIETEFSSDLHAFDFLGCDEDDYLNLNILIECKYRYPGVRWIFSPYPEESTVVLGFVNYLEELCTERLESTDSLYEFERSLENCTKGIELHGKGVDPNGISRGLHQLRYAVPNLVAQEYRAQITTWNETDLAISCVCPILVTTASLHTLKLGLGLEAFQSAADLDDVATEVESLVVYQKPGPQLRRYCNEVSRTLHRQYPDIAQRLDEFEKFMGTHRGVLPSTWTFNDHFTSATTNILVVRLDALDKTLDFLRNSVLEASRVKKRVATLSVDLVKRTKHIVPFDGA